MFGEHLEEVRSLMEIKRYQNRFKHKERSVAEHSWFVSKIAHGLAIWERDKFKKHDVDMERVLFLAINHDIVECYTGDILSTTKDLSPVLREELLNVEEKIFNGYIVDTIPESWGDSYVSIHDELAELKTIESRIVKAADLIDRVFECVEEIELSNKDPYIRILKNDLETLGNFGLISVDYFLKYSIKDIKAEKYIPKNIKERLDNTDYSPYF